MTATDNKRLAVALAVITTTMWICWLMWPKKERVVQMEQITELRIEPMISDVSIANSPPKKILYWGNYFGIPWTDDSSFPYGNISCPGGVQCCLTSVERDFASSDAVFIHSRAHEKLPPASLRPHGQLWVFYTLESPPHAGTFYKKKNVFNLTMTYLRKSDIVESYGMVLPGRFGGGFNSSRNYLEGKNKSAVAVISNCVRERLQYVDELSKFIDVDVYGKCGKQKLCDNCWEKLRQYKFYLSFENSICIDYVTEKFYDNGLKFGMVPVVLGGANYSDPSVAPPGSYINARDFVSVQELAEFLSKVGSEPQLYNQYFQWHSHYNIYRKRRDMCELCVHLHQNRSANKVYEDVIHWYRTEGHCEPYPIARA